MIYLFGALDCEKCNGIKLALHELGVVFAFIDANADENQELADTYKVDEMPHIVILDDTNTVSEQFVGDECLKFVSRQVNVKNS